MKKCFRRFCALSLLLSVFCYFTYRIIAQDQIDSIKQILLQQPDNKEKADNLLDIGKDYYKKYSMDSAEQYILKALQLSKQISYTEGIANAYYRWSLLYYKTGDYNIALEKIKIVLSIADSIQDSMFLGKGNWLLGTLQRETGNHSMAVINFKNSLSIYCEMNDSICLLSVFQSLGNLFLNMAEYDSAAYYYHKTVEYCETLDHEKGLAIALSQLGKVYYLLPVPQYTEARQYLFRSLQINRKHNQLNEIAQVYSKLANIANHLYELDSALFYYEKAQELYIQIGNKVGLVHNYNNIAEVYEKQERYSDALGNYEKALVFYQEQSMDEGIVVSLLNIADIYADLGKYSLAHIYYDSSLNLAIIGGYKNYQKNILINKTDTYYSEENYRKAFDCQKQYHDLEDSIFSLKTAEIIADLKLKYEKEKDQALILNLENENLAKDLSLRKRTNQRNIYLFSGIGIIAIILFVFVFYRQKALKDNIIAEQRIKQLEEEKKLLAAKFLVEGQDKERKRIAKELHDGLGVLLSTTKMQFTSIKDKSPENREIIDKATKMLERATGDVRKISHNMMPGLLTRFGLFEAVEDLIDNLNETEGLKAVCEISGDTKRLPENTEIMLYRIIQELVNNSLKHAEAKNIWLHMNLSPEKLDINFSDDGKGFIVAEKLESKSIGLNSIHSRVSFLNGIIKIKSEPGKGVKYTIHTPIV